MNDTVGRYVTQQAGATQDKAGWHGFLGLLLKDSKPPINGAIVMLDVAKLLEQNESEQFKDSTKRPTMRRIHGGRSGVQLKRNGG
ncbi:MAG: type VI secretion protein IcmF/TssM N-terminal domain-containing protein [Collimonas pratensis]|uniref:type VI secretion protein IcmF/TssM N-terminal domain-containing protein n=1 Tax=Collimonas pratensis TaxID=279113 RepID=UPI003C758512